MGYNLYIKKDRLDDKDPNLISPEIKEWYVNKKNNTFELILKTDISFSIDEIYVIAILFSKTEVINTPINIVAELRDDSDNIIGYRCEFIGLSKDDILLFNTHSALGDLSTEEN